MSISTLPHQRMSAEVLAKWIEKRPEKWWFVDGDPILTSRLDFPCPADELAPELRRLGGELLVEANPPAASGSIESADRLDELTDTNNRLKRRTLHLQWMGKGVEGVDWLLMEDDALVEKRPAPIPH